MTDFFDFAEKHGFALFPMLRGSKTPHGVVPSFAHDWSKNPEQWKKWRADHNPNFGIVAGPSDLLVVDVDLAKVGRDAAWKTWADWCAERGLPAFSPFCQTARQGWHVAFRLPSGFDAATLRQAPLVSGIDVRVRNGFVVAPGSDFQGLPYQLMPNARVHEAPQAVLTACSRSSSTTPVPVVGEYDTQDVTALVKWLAERGAFEHHDDWVSAGMALKTALGEEGRAIWRETCDGTVTEAVEEAKWRSFATEPKRGCVTLSTWFQKAHALGWTGTVRKSSSAMFDGVAQIALKGPRSMRSRRIDAASLEGKPIPAREWLVRDLVPGKNVTLLYGDGGTGKSLLALQLSVAVVMGKPFFGHTITRGRVEFVTAEDSLDEMHRRLVDIARAIGTSLGSLSGLQLTSLTETDAMLAVAPDSRGGALAVTELYNELESVIAETRPTLVVLDTLADIFGGNEVIRAQARQFIGMLRRLCLRFDCSTVVLAHPSLAGMERGTSGSTGWNNSVRSRLHFGRVHDADGSEADEDARTLRVGKSNYGRVGLEIPMRWKAGAFVAEGHAAAGDQVATTVKAERVFLEMLDRANRHSTYVSASKNANNYAPNQFARDAIKQGVKKRDLVDAMHRLLDRGQIENAPYGSPSRMSYRLQRVHAPAVPAPPLAPITA